MGIKEDADIIVLLTCVGGLVSPGIIDNLRDIAAISRIIGVDTSAEAVGFHMVDRGYVVPMGDKPEYIPVIMEIMEREGVNVIIPCSDEEVLSLSSQKKLFREKGVAILCSPYETTSTAIDKGSMLNFLRQQGVPVPEFSLPGTLDELVQGARELGYPDRPVVVKPRRGRGGRGFRVLQEKVDVLTSRDSHEMKLDWLVEALQPYGRLDVVLMEYLPGEDFSVDVLADKGRLLFMVPRRRIKSILGPSQVGEIVCNSEVRETVEMIVSRFGFDSNVNIQLKGSASLGTKPLVYEINPRISGTIVAGTAAGIDLLWQGIRHALGFPPTIAPMTAPESVRMVRYLKEYFVK